MNSPCNLEKLVFFGFFDLNHNFEKNVISPKIVVQAFMKKCEKPQSHFYLAENVLWNVFFSCKYCSNSEFMLYSCCGFVRLNKNNF